MNLQTPKRRKRSVAYVSALEEELRQLKQARSSQGPASSPGTLATNAHASDASADNGTGDPLFDTPVTCSDETAPRRTTLIGDSTCTAFDERILNCVGAFPSTTSRYAGFSKPYFKHIALLRSSEPRFELPNRIHASLLIQRALKFVGMDYHLVRIKLFFSKLDEAYMPHHHLDRIWRCSLFVMLALGELYSNWRGDDSESPIPGTQYFLQAVSFLEDNYEDASVDHVQALNLISFYSNALGRTQSAYVYAGIALRMALGLGLHRRQPSSVDVTAVQREDRCRVWWTVYLLDRLLCSRLGYPLTIRDEDIDLELPSMESLTEVEQEEFADPAHLIANIQLARITGSMMNTIYCLPGRGQTSFVHRVHLILSKLRSWDEHLPVSLRKWDAFSPRNVFSLHLAYNQCIIKTTRPVLLHMFSQKLNRTDDSARQDQPIDIANPTARTLSEACVQAACTSNSILSKLFVEGILATFGYFDALYLFSSTLVLIISAVLEPDATVSDAVQTAFQLLKSMAETGNLPARGYYDRLCRVRNAIENMRLPSSTGSAQPSTYQDHNALVAPTQASDAGVAEMGGRSRKRFLPENCVPGFDPSTSDPLNFDALDNPFIEHFLAHGADGWAESFEMQDPTLQELAGQMGDDFLADSV